MVTCYSWNRLLFPNDYIVSANKQTRTWKMLVATVDFCNLQFNVYFLLSIVQSLLNEFPVASACVVSMRK